MGGTGSKEKTIDDKVKDLVAREEERARHRGSAAAGASSSLSSSPSSVSTPAASSDSSGSPAEDERPGGGAAGADTDVFKDGRYRVARPETIKLLQSQQASPEQQAQHIMYQQMSKKDLRQYIKEQEGLELGQQRRQMLAQQWRYFLFSEPVQRGLDAGIILGSCTAAAAVVKPQNRVPLRVAVFWLGGFCVGMMSIPMLVMAAESRNEARIKAQERAMFQEQRRQFLDERKAS